MLPRRRLPSIYAFIWCATLLGSLHAYADEPATGKLPVIAIIIDDMGYRLSEGYRALDLPGPLAYSFLPHAPSTSKLSAEAARRGKDVLLHLPMQALAENHLLGPGALTLQMDEQAIATTLRADLESVPAAIGVNNHMGSLLTKKRAHMQWLMDTLKSHNLFFVDSRTVRDSIAGRVAMERDVPFLARDVFLDNHSDHAYVRSQFELLVTKARGKGFALGIAHPHEPTLNVLVEVLPRLQDYGVNLIAVRDLIDARKNADGQRKVVARIRVSTR